MSSRFFRLLSLYFNLCSEMKVDLMFSKTGAKVFLGCRVCSQSCGVVALVPGRGPCLLSAGPVPGVRDCPIEQ